MTTTNDGIEIIKVHEALRLNAYRDTTGIPTIGWGHTGTAYMGMTITREEAIRLLRNDLHTAESAIKKYVIDKGVALTPNQFDALVSLVFNVGTGTIFTKNYNNQYKRGSTLYNRLLAKDYVGAANRFLDFKKAGGEVLPALVRRRKEEKELFEKDNISTQGGIIGVLSIITVVLIFYFKKYAF